jgi:hypothetical protein
MIGEYCEWKTSFAVTAVGKFGKMRVELMEQLAPSTQIEIGTSYRLWGPTHTSDLWES